MKYIKIIDNLENVSLRELNCKIAQFDEAGWQIDEAGWQNFSNILSQINGYNFIVDRGYFFKLKQLFKAKFNEQITSSFGGFVVEKDDYSPAICVGTTNQTIVFTMDAAYKLENDEITAEDRGLSIDWLTILKQKFGIGYVKKLTNLAQLKKEEQIKIAEQNYDEYIKKLIDAELNFQTK